MMTGREIEEMVATDRLNAWEDLNAPDPLEKYLTDAAKSLKGALKNLDEAISLVAEGAAALSGTPLEYVVGSVADDLDGIKADLQKMQENYERGCRS